MASVKACLQFLPCLLYLTWHLAFITFGAFVFLDSKALDQKPCGKTYHMMKFISLNFVFALLTLSSYLVFPGGGEGARARAVVIIVFHFAFAMWGVLMWVDMTSTCINFFSTHYSMAWIFHHTCVGYHVLFLTIMFVHEAYLGDKLGSDFTLIGEFSRAPINLTTYDQVTSASPTNGSQPRFSADMPADAKDYADMTASPHMNQP